MEVYRLLMAIRKHVEQMDAIMRAPPTHDRGRKIAQSINELESASRLPKRQRPRHKAQR